MKEAPIGDRQYNFKPGDKVTWTHAKKSRHSVQFSTRTGSIDEVCVFTAKVRMRNGRCAIVRLDRIAPADQETHLTKEFKKLTDEVLNKESRGA